LPLWLPLSLFALVVWAVQRLLSKVALQDLGTGKLCLLSAVVSLLTYAPYLVLRPPAVPELPPAFGLSCLMASQEGGESRAQRRNGRDSAQRAAANRLSRDTNGIEPAEEVNDTKQSDRQRYRSRSRGLRRVGRSCGS
jgi:hypothetical protein